MSDLLSRMRAIFCIFWHTKINLGLKGLRDVFAKFGLPERIVTDNAPNFVSAEFSKFLHHNGIKQTTSAPYHPASNNLAKRAVKIFKNGMKKMKEGSLAQTLARFLFSYRITPQSTTGVSPSELLMNRKLRSVLDLLKPNVTDRVNLRRHPRKFPMIKEQYPEVLHLVMLYMLVITAHTILVLK